MKWIQLQSQPFFWQILENRKGACASLEKYLPRELPTYAPTLLDFIDKIPPTQYMNRIFISIGPL